MRQFVRASELSKGELLAGLNSGELMLWRKDSTGCVWLKREATIFGVPGERQVGECTITRLGFDDDEEVEDDIDADDD